jgi:hypothetical protein
MDNIFNKQTNCKYIKIQDLKQNDNVMNGITYESKDIIEFCNYESLKIKEKYEPERIYAEYSNYQNSKRPFGDYCKNNFIATYLYAYNNYKDIVFSVNDLWAVITLNLSKYINDNSEILRNKFVFHEDKIELNVIEYANSIEESISMEYKWDNFFEQIIKHINANTKGDVVNMIINDFSVGDKFYTIMSVATIMDSFKKYFSYGRCILGCGIPGVHLEGTREDWIKLKTKIENLASLSKDSGDSNDPLIMYIKATGKIIGEFINTYDGNVNVEFWNRIAATEERRIGSGSQIQTYLEGWITHFYQIYKKIDLGSIHDYRIEVPIKLTNELTNQIKNMKMHGGFNGVIFDEKTNAYRPQLSLVIYHHEE